MARIQVGEGSIYYERHGDGFPVLLISGLSGVASFWKDQVPTFARKFDVITHDHRGIGNSDMTHSGYTVDRMATDVIGLMDALEIKRAHIVGHSTGGAIAQTLALDHPSRVASIVLSASWTKPDAYFRRFYGLRKDILLRLGPSAYVAANSLFLYPGAYVAKNNEKLRQAEAQTLAVFPPTEIAASRIDAILAFDRTDQLNKIKTPTLVIGSEDDLITPAYFSEELARRIPGAEVKLFQNGGHSFTQVRAREFNQAVLPFLTAHTPNS